MRGLGGRREQRMLAYDVCASGGLGYLSGAVWLVVEPCDQRKDIINLYLSYP